MTDAANIIYGRLKEAAHISGYTFARTSEWLETLLADDAWRSVGTGFTDVNVFLRSIDLSPFNIGDNRPGLVRRIKQLQPDASIRAIAEATGESKSTIQRDLAPVPNGTPEPKPEPIDQQEHAGPVPNGTPEQDQERDAIHALLEGEPEPLKEFEELVKPARNSDDEWYTPQWLFDALGIRYSIDVCAPADRTHTSVPADTYLTIEDDGLAQPWHGTVWCNPPYSLTDPWARRMIHHGDGLILCHVPINAGWCVELWDACDGIRLFQAVEFLRPDGTVQRPAWWLQLAAFGPVATAALAGLQPLGTAAYNKRRVASPMWQRGC
jgi:DNA N-6-adenine-methyltransferase (Dam)